MDQAEIKFNYICDGETNPPFDFGLKPGFANVNINIENRFYKLFIEPLESLDDSAHVAFELLFASCAIALDKLDTYQHDENIKLLKKWRIILDDYIEMLNE